MAAIVQELNFLVKNELKPAETPWGGDVTKISGGIYRLSYRKSRCIRNAKTPCVWIARQKKGTSAYLIKIKQTFSSVDATNPDIPLLISNLPMCIAPNNSASLLNPAIIAPATTRHKPQQNKQIT
eukprot:scaffold3247_cov44-Cyclotella_meneghiniana.AAC.4